MTLSFFSPSHQHPLKLSSLGRNSTFGLPLGVVYDSIFLLSSGRVTSIGPTGQFNWQVDTQSDWDTATDILYNKETGTSLSEHYIFSTESFTPTITTYSLKPYGKKVLSHLSILLCMHPFYPPVCPSCSIHAYIIDLSLHCNHVSIHYSICPFYRHIY